MPAVGAARGPPSTSGPVRRCDPSPSFGISRLSDRTELMRRPVDERGDALASEPESDSKSDRAQDCGPEEGVPEPGQPQLRIERAGDGQHQGQAKREAEALGGLDQPRGEAFFPGRMPRYPAATGRGASMASPKVTNAVEMTRTRFRPSRFMSHEDPQPPTKKK